MEKFLWEKIHHTEELMASKPLSDFTLHDKDYISECLDRLRAHYDTVSALSHEDNGIKEDGGLVGSPATINKLKGEAVKMCRVMKVLQEYIGECDGDFALERKILPLHRYLISSDGVCYSACLLGRIPGSTLKVKLKKAEGI
jgi:hypothetical protein